MDGGKSSTEASQNRQCGDRIKVRRKAQGSLGTFGVGTSDNRTMSHEQVNWSKSYKQNSSMNMLPHKCKLSLSRGGNGDLVKLVVNFICNNDSQRVWGRRFAPKETCVNICRHFWLCGRSPTGIQCIEDAAKPLQCIGHALTTKNYQVQNVNSADVRHAALQAVRLQRRYEGDTGSLGKKLTAIETLQRSQGEGEMSKRKSSQVLSKSSRRWEQRMVLYIWGSRGFLKNLKNSKVNSDESEYPSGE